MPYSLSKAANEDIFDIYYYGLVEFGEAQADAYYQRLLDACEMLAEHPNAGHSRGYFDPPSRTYPVGAHVIAYDVVDERIEIVRILSARQDWSRFL